MPEVLARHLVQYMSVTFVVWDTIALFLNRIEFPWDFASCRLVIGGVSEEAGLPSPPEL
jgi:hypothetical protein